MTGQSLYAYTDESGNSGLNLFDKGQPFFWTGTIISPNNLDIEAKELVNFCKEKLGVEELHANALGFGKIEEVAKAITEFIMSSKIRFIFTRIEKGHVPPMKFVDTILDSGVNNAVSPMHYGQRSLRLTMALELSKHISPENSKKFWTIYGSGDIKVFKEILSNVLWNIEMKTTDWRLKELLLDAISWAKNNPEKFLEDKKSNLDSPNIMAFTQILNSMHSIYKATNAQIKTFIHDEQNQFARYLEEAFSYFRRFSPSVDQFAWMTDINEVETFLEDEIIFQTSDSSNGLQLVDIALWLMKQRIDKPDKEIFGECKNLTNAIILNGDITQFSRGQLISDVFETMQTIARIPLSSTDIQRGSANVEYIEDIRKSRSLLKSSES
ncbi:DUF3800 domain-containing protein [Bacillus altitudinis]|uniref:DUF3800 domain-containing protein n=1 Tax=Bacillus altitudinis TaxID=293387 RepID=UPI003314900E